MLFRSNLWNDGRGVGRMQLPSQALIQGSAVRRCDQHTAHRSFFATNRLKFHHHGAREAAPAMLRPRLDPVVDRETVHHHRSEEHTSELQSLMRISYAVFCLQKKRTTHPLLPIYHLIYYTYSYHISVLLLSYMHLSLHLS